MRWRGLTIFAIGHSTRTTEELVALLWGHGVATLVDIRTVPRSRTNPQFNRETLVETLPTFGLAYTHVAELGGLRKTIGVASKNQAWRNLSFRGYADHMQTRAFEHGLEQLHRLTTTQGPVAYMCAEGNRWRCHRSLVSDALLARGAKVFHLESDTRATPHRLTPFARVKRGRVTYPAPQPRNTNAPDLSIQGAVNFRRTKRRSYSFSSAFSSPSAAAFSGRSTSSRKAISAASPRRKRVRSRRV